MSELDLHTIANLLRGVDATMMALIADRDPDQQHRPKWPWVKLLVWEIGKLRGGFRCDGALSSVQSTPWQRLPCRLVCALRRAA